jgi:hypothetical protein
LANDIECDTRVADVPIGTDNTCSPLSTFPFPVHGFDAHLKADLAVIDLNPVVQEVPAPMLRNGSSALVEAAALDGELLITYPHTLLATPEAQIGHVPSRAILHEDALLSGLGAVFRPSSKLEVHVPETGSLCDLVMDARTLCGGIDSCQINDQMCD